MYKQITSWPNLKEALRKALLGKRHKKEAQIFLQDETYNLKKLQKELRTKTYRPGKYKKFYVLVPKRRLIYAPTFRDKVVQHAINNITHEYLVRKMSSRSYACIKGRGHRACLKTIVRNNKLANENLGPSPYVVSIDIVKFFYSIRPAILAKQIVRYFKSKLRYLYLLIVKSSPTIIGLPLGNLINQTLANLYLTSLDKYIERKLGCRYYTRYADDLLLYAKDKKSAIYLRHNVSVYLRNTLLLSTHADKSHITPISKSYKTLGFKVYEGRIQLTSAIKRNAMRKLKQFKVNDKATQTKYATLKDYLSVACSKGFLNKVISHVKEAEIYANTSSA